MEVHVAAHAMIGESERQEGRVYDPVGGVQIHDRGHRAVLGEHVEVGGEGGRERALPRHDKRGAEEVVADDLVVARPDRGCMRGVGAAPGAHRFSVRGERVGVEKVHHRLAAVELGAHPHMEHKTRIWNPDALLEPVTVPLSREHDLGPLPHRSVEAPRRRGGVQPLGQPLERAGVLGDRLDGHTGVRRGDQHLPPRAGGVAHPQGFPPLPA